MKTSNLAFQQVERRNGMITTWWHYNRVVILIALIAVGILSASLRETDAHRLDAEADARLLAHAVTSFDCYAQTRPTSILIVGGSQQQVDDALRSVSLHVDQTRGTLLAAQWNAAHPK